MSVLLSFLDAIIFLVHQIIWFYIWIVIIASVLSWVNLDPFNPAMQIFSRLTNPVFNMIRRFIPTRINSVDLAPLIVIFVLVFLDRLLGNLISLV